ncbi:MAG: hypothetical protein JWR10_4549 [Rubritepida sp.]|nr:hypothetical protein [Rubritepida sp.]
MGRASPKASGVARFRSLLIRLMVALLFIQSGAAMAHCLRAMAHDGTLIEICSTDGMRTIRLDAAGEPLQEQAPGSDEGSFCPVCHGLPAVTLPEPPMLAMPAWDGAAITWHAAGIERLRPPARAPPYSTRAPPTITA